MKTKKSSPGRFAWKDPFPPLPRSLFAQSISLGRSRRSVRRRAPGDVVGRQVPPEGAGPGDRPRRCRSESQEAGTFEPPRLAPVRNFPALSPFLELSNDRRRFPNCSVLRSCCCCCYVPAGAKVSEQDCPHLLFYGPSGSGKKTLIMALLRQMFGSSSDKVLISSDCLTWCFVAVCEKREGGINCADLFGMWSSAFRWNMVSFHRYFYRRLWVELCFYGFLQVRVENKTWKVDVSADTFMIFLMLLEILLLYDRV